MKHLSLKSKWSMRHVENYKKMTNNMYQKVRKILHYIEPDLSCLIALATLMLALLAACLRIRPLEVVSGVFPTLVLSSSSSFLLSMAGSLIFVCLNMCIFKLFGRPRNSQNSHCTFIDWNKKKCFFKDLWNFQCWENLKYNFQDFSAFISISQQEEFVTSSSSNDFPQEFRWYLSPSIVVKDLLLQR